MTSRDVVLMAGFDEGVSNWLVVRTKPRQERIAGSHLRLRGVAAYCPMFLEPPWHSRAPKGPVPLFSGYIFASCRPSMQLGAVRYCPGVLEPLAFGGRLATVETLFIQALRAREGERGYILADELDRQISAGQKVRVMAGPLKGLEGVFKGYLRGRQRVRLLMSFLRARYLVEVETTVVAAVRA